MNLTLNKREFRDAIKLQHDWEFKDIQAACVSRDMFDVDHAMICIRGGFTIQCKNEIHDLKAEMFQTVCTDVKLEPVLQEIKGEVLLRNANKAPDTQLDIPASDFWQKNSL